MTKNETGLGPCPGCDGTNVIVAEPSHAFQVLCLNRNVPDGNCWNGPWRNNRADAVTAFNSVSQKVADYDGLRRDFEIAREIAYCLGEKSLKLVGEQEALVTLLKDSAALMRQISIYGNTDAILRPTKLLNKIDNLLDCVNEPNPPDDETENNDT